MEDTSDNRKLAAVMFADLEGYTTLFQKNEQGAFSLVGQHHHDLRQLTRQYHGQVVKYYGDGSLTLFNSIIQAVQCAIDLQRISREHLVPLRIGIHLGEMIEKEEDVYGDAVNVASRIQALGVSGSILVSKTVAQELKNHPGIRTKSLGRVRLKNVEQPVEVFALNMPDLAIPHAMPGSNLRLIKRLALYGLLPLVAVSAGLWLKDKLTFHPSRFGDECMVIPPFVSHQTTEGIKDFSTIASFALTKAMSESAKANIIPYSSMLLYTNATIATWVNNPKLSRRLGAEYEIKGDYTLEGKNADTLRISLSILDLKTDRLLQTPIPEIRCSSDNYVACLEEAKNRLVGYWKSKSDNLFHFTTDSAYRAFIIAQTKWASPGEERETKSYLLRAIRFDPKFMDAWLLLLDWFHNEEQYEHGLDTLALIKRMIPEMTPRERNYLAYHEADFQGKNTAAFLSFMKEYRQNPRDLFINTTGMVMALEYLNDPMTTLQMFRQISPDSIDLSTCVYCMTRFDLAVKAYLQLAQVAKAKQLAQRMLPYARKEPHFITLLSLAVSSGDTVMIDATIRMAVRNSSYPDEEPYLQLVTARIATSQGKLALRDPYLKKAMATYRKSGQLNLARCYLLDNNLKAAKSIYLNDLEKEKPGAATPAYLGILYAREGDRVSANAMIEKLESMKERFDFGYTAYYQGRIKANLQEYESAIHYFSLALEEGIRFLPSGTFLNDPDLVIMNTYKPYLELLGSLRQYKFE